MTSESDVWLCGNKIVNHNELRQKETAINWKDNNFPLQLPKVIISGLIEREDITKYLIWWCAFIHVIKGGDKLHVSGRYGENTRCVYKFLSNFNRKSF